jgi:hypothetical protein
MNKEERERTREWLNRHLERNEAGTGWYAYKVFGAYYKPPKGWRIEPGETIGVGRLNRDFHVGCAMGVHASTLGWIINEFYGSGVGKFEDGTRIKPLYQVEILEEDLVDIVVPYEATGKFRCRRMRIVKEVGTVRLRSATDWAKGWPEIERLDSEVRLKVARQIT